MKRIIAFLSISLLFFTACEQTTDKKDADKLYIVTTTQMIADAVRNIAGDQAEVISLMGPGVDPHYYKATQGDLEKLTKADIIFYNGLHLEGKMQDVFEKFSNQKMVVAVSKDIAENELIVTSDQGQETIHDPHIWHSVNLWKNVVPVITESLVSKDSENAPSYEENGSVFIEKLKDLDETTSAAISQIPKQQRLLITSHDAFNYFGKTYDIEVKGLQGISTVSEIGIKDITQMVDVIIKRKVKAVFVESSVNERNLRAVIEGCQKKNWEVQIGGTLFSDAMGADETPEGTYIGMIKYNTNAIVNALK